MGDKIATLQMICRLSRWLPFQMLRTNKFSHIFRNSAWEYNTRRFDCTITLDQVPIDIEEIEQESQQAMMKVKCSKKCQNCTRIMTFYSHFHNWISIESSELIGFWMKLVDAAGFILMGAKIFIGKPIKWILIDKSSMIGFAHYNMVDTIRFHNKSFYWFSSKFRNGVLL